MARLPVIEPENATGTAKEAFEGPLKTMPLNIFKGMANSQSGLPAYLGLSHALAQGGLSDKEKEAVALVVGEANDCDYCRGAHTMLGTKAGLTEEQTVEIRSGGSTGDGKLDALVAFARRLVEARGFIEDRDLKQFKDAGYTDAHVVDVLVAHALNTFTNYFNHVNETELDIPAAPALA